MDAQRARSYINARWGDSIERELIEYIRIPNKSSAFDADWQAHGHMDAAVALIEGWCKHQAIPGLTVEVVRLAGRTPLIVAEVPGTAPGNVLLYGHLDKQPEMQGWRDGLGPWKPVLEGDRLFGRGGADDGYAAFASLTAIAALDEQQLPRPRCVMLIEASEESGSPDLPDYMEALAERIGTPDLVVCLDSGCGNYDQLWSTTSLRGMVAGTLRVTVLDEGVHSGDASGIVPSTFRILRQLLERIEDQTSGRVTLTAAQAAIPTQRAAQARRAAAALGDAVFDKFPLRPGVRPEGDDLGELVLNRTWRPALSVIGVDGIPALAEAGNVTLPTAALRISLRVPPTCDAAAASVALKEALERDPPHGAEVRLDSVEHATGWDAPELAPWLAESLTQASHDFFGGDALTMGEGGSIPFMGMLGARFPEAQFLVTGVLGPQSNAHGPNEFLHLPTARKLTACVARVLTDLARQGHLV